MAGRWFAVLNIVDFRTTQLRRKLSSKILEIVVSSLRVDRVLATGLGRGRRKVELSLLSGNVFVNKEKVEKKSRCVEEGDVIDLHVKDEEVDNNNNYMSRVVVHKIGEKTSKGKYWVELERWKHYSQVERS